MILLSTNAKNDLMTSLSFREIFNGGYLWFYDGTPPVTADLDVTGNLIGAVTSDGLVPNRNSNEFLRNGLSFSFVAVDGMLKYEISELHTWHIYVAQVGTPTWFRFTAWNDLPTGNSTIKSRFDGVIGDDLILTKIPFALSDTEVIDSFTVYL